MRVLVYGAGVVGSYLAHYLYKSGKDITLLARGSWYNKIHEDGLIIRHTLQLKTTKDHINVIDSLFPDDVYDIVFVVVQYCQLADIIPILAANRSKTLVFIGNNADPLGTKSKIDALSTEGKTILFGFAGSAGIRNQDKVISVHFIDKMTLGSLDNTQSNGAIVEMLFSGTKYKIVIHNDIETWLLCHLAFILPLCYASYENEGSLKRISRNKIDQILDAVVEGYRVIQSSGKQVPQDDLDYYIYKRKKARRLIRLLGTRIGKLLLGNHAMNAIREMTELTIKFAELRRKASISTPNWDALEPAIYKIQSLH